MTCQLLGPHGHDYTPLARCLTGFHDTELVFVPNPGNAGDNLINLGMYRLFDHLGVRFTTGTREGTYPDRVVVYSGGGALLDLYPGSDSFFRRNHSVVRSLVLLPHTVRAHPDLWEGMDERCVLFARERPSYDYLMAHRTRAKVHQVHDLAFFLSDADIARLRWSPRFLLRPKVRGPWARMIVKLALAARRNPVLHAFRTDIEATGIALPAENLDLARLFSTEDMSRASCVGTVKAMRRVMRMFERVETNRLHTAVLAAILGLPVRMHDNSYGKNRAIYEYSIRNRFPNVEFMERPA